MNSKKIEVIDIDSCTRSFCGVDDIAKKTQLSTNNIINALKGSVVMIGNGESRITMLSNEQSDVFDLWINKSNTWFYFIDVL